MTTSSEMGRYLARLREKAGLRQNELAHRITWSPASLSRVESGEREVSTDELKSILDAIGTREAEQFGETHARVWQKLERPRLGHPDEQILWQAEKAIRDIDKLKNAPEITHLFATRLDEFRSGLTEAATLAAKTEYNVAFIGKIGVGKSTAICRIAGLEVAKDGKVQPVLDVGAGGTTVCEVRIAQGKGYGIHIEPMDSDAFHREVLEFAHFLTRPLVTGPEAGEQDRHGTYGEQDGHGTSKEIERAIRNMSGLTTIRGERLANGRRERIDRARNLAREFPDHDTLTGEILSKIGIQRRTRRHLQYPEISGKEPLLWLKETFEQVNNGRHPECSLPKRIDIVVPEEPLGAESLSVCLVDTKGIFATAERADLEAHFGDPCTVVVLCSSFNDAPSTEVQHLLQRAVNGGIGDIKTTAAVLVLPHPGEARAMKDDQGEVADTVADGYEMKGEQAETRLESENIGCAGIAFFNSLEDDPKSLAGFLLERIEGIRAMHRGKLEQVIADSKALVENFAKVQVQEIYQQAARRLLVWLENNREINAPATHLEGPLLNAILSTNASSVHASVRRQGDWYNLDCAYQLGYGARTFTNSMVRSKLDDFGAIATNLLQDSELEPASALVQQSLRIMESEVETLLNKSEQLGRRIYIEHLEPDALFWDRCESEWGRGSGYRDRVEQHSADWFAGENRDYQAMALELVRQEWLRIHRRLMAILTETESGEEIAA